MARSFAIDTLSTYYGTIEANQEADSKGSVIVLRALRGVDGLTWKELERTTELSEPALERSLDELVKSGIVDQVGGKGEKRFSLTPAAKTLARDD